MIYFILFWLICAFISTGISVAFFQRKFSLIAKEWYRTDLAFSVLMGLFGGPAMLFVIFFMSEFAKYGWTLSPPKE